MPTVFVAGATGRIGSPVARLLIARGHHVVAGTRDPRSPAAAALARRGARIVHADFDDMASLAAGARMGEAVVSAGTATANAMMKSSGFALPVVSTQRT